MEIKGKLIMTVDLDEWYYCRWATGSPNSIWPSTNKFFEEYYGTTKPTGELYAPTEKILDLFNKHSIKATFFVTGEACSYYPDLVKEIVENGHSVACHGLKHVDADLVTREQYQRDIEESKRTIENTIKNKVIGYRAPNLIVYPWMIDILENKGFLYDSSVCLCRSINGKYGYTKAPSNPYRLSEKDMQEPGNRKIIEFPIPAFPYLKLPGANGHMTRIAGLWWVDYTLRKALQNGYGIYFFHPFELAKRPKNINKKFYFRNSGPKFINMLSKLLTKYNCIPIEDVLENYIRIPRKE